MPVFKYSCPNCNHKLRKLVRKAGEKVLCQRCNDPMVKIITNCPDLLVTEKTNDYKNTNAMKDVGDIVRKRSKKYFMEHCVDDAMEKIRKNFGEKEAIEHAKRSGWIDKNTGKKKEVIDIE